MSTRKTWDEYFLDLVPIIGSRATCDRGKSGCIITRDNRIIATGYVGSPVGLPHCDEAGHDMKKVTHADGRVTEHCVRTIHAEMNAILQGAKYGVKLEGAELYCYMVPCRNCAMAIVNVGIRRVVALRRYQDDHDSVGMFLEAGVDFSVVVNSVAQYGVPCGG